MTNLTNDSTWIKASEMVLQKFGKDISYRSIKLIDEALKATVQEGFYSFGDDLIIPLKLKDADLGDVVVRRGSFLNEKQKNEIAELIKLLVEPKVYSLQLIRAEENLKNSQKKSLTLVNKQSVISLYQAEKFQKQTLSNIILLKSHTELTRNKVALKIHEMTERNLFVHLYDILFTLKTKEDIKSLSDVTVYVDDIESVPYEVLTLLQEYFDLNEVDGPLFLVGSSLSTEFIQQKNWPEGIKKDLLAFYFDIDRVPLSQQTNEDILELLFFKLDSVLT